MNETIESMAWVCAECAPKPDPRYRKMPVQEFVGKSCKLAFPWDNTEEHMWVDCVELSEHEGPELQGVLASHPVLVDGLQRGDRVEFSRYEIEDVLGGG